MCGTCRAVRGPACNVATKPYRVALGVVAESRVGLDKHFYVHIEACTRHRASVASMLTWFSALQHTYQVTALKHVHAKACCNCLGSGAAARSCTGERSSRGGILPERSSRTACDRANSCGQSNTGAFRRARTQKKRPQLHRPCRGS